MTKREVLDFIANGFTLANLPESFHRLSEIAKDPHSDIEDVVHVVRRDPELAANLLKLANSSLYNPTSDPVTSIEEASQKLGLKLIVESSLALGIINAIEINPAYFDLHAYWSRSLTIAYITESVLSISPGFVQNRVDKNTLFTAALLHDIGLLVLMQGFPDEMMNVVEYALVEDLPLQDAELQKLTFSHQDVGRILFKRWKLPMDLQAVAGYHHKPMHLTSIDLSTLVDIVHISDYICSNRSIADQRTTFKPILQKDVWKRAGISLDQIPEITEKAAEAADAADCLLAC